MVIKNPLALFHRKEERPRIPARKDRLRESHDSNKENNSRCDSLTEHYVEELMGEGYDRAMVVRALSIALNNMEMARDILREFVPKS